MPLLRNKVASISSVDEVGSNDEINIDNPTTKDDEVFVNGSTLDWGWRSFKPSCLQWLNSPKWFSFFLCGFITLQGMTVNSFVSLSLPTLEKRFQLTSKQTGFIVAANDIPALLLTVFVGFYGGYGHKTKWLGYGAMLTGISALVFALPKLLVGKYQPLQISSESSTLCISNATMSDTACSTDDISFNVYFFIFVLAQMLAGAGTAPLYALGPAYMDENVHPKSMSTYLGLFYLAGLVGPGVGSLFGGQLLSIYVDIVMPDGISLTSRDQRWVGAWWLGPVACGFLLLLDGFILLGFPRKLPGSDAIRKEAIEKGYIKKDKIAIKGFKSFLPHLKALLTNGTFMFQNLAFCFDTIISIGVGPFLYKFLTGRYGASPSEGGIGIIILLLPSSTLGMLIGSLIVKKLGVKDSARRAAKAAFFLHLISFWALPILLMPGCSYSQYAGADFGYLNSSALKLSDPCNTNCHCSTSEFRPLCGPNGESYFSPCLAGCTQHIPNKGFTNCSCVNVLVNTTSMKTNHAILKDGSCQQNCPRANLYGFILGLFVVVFFGVLNTIPSKAVTLRSVSESQRSLGLGIQFSLIRLLTSIPSPVLVGAIIDATCTLWNTECNVNQNCLNYDYDKLGIMIVILGLSTQVLSLICYGLSWFCSKDPEPATTVQVCMESKGADHKDDTNRNNLDKPRSEAVTSPVTSAFEL